jgi:protein SDA1
MSFFKEDAKSFPGQLTDLLESSVDSLDPTLRRTIIQALILLSNKDIVSRMNLLPLMFKLFAVQDKQLRKLMFDHIVNDIRKVNRKGNNPRVNSALQSFMYKMLKGESEVAAKKSIDVMIELWRRKVWNNDKTVNVMVTACLDTKHQGLVAISTSIVNLLSVL